MTFRWLRGRVLIACVAVALVFPAIIVGLALWRASGLRSTSPIAANYLQQATFGGDTLIGLAIATLVIAVILYAGALAILYWRRVRRESDAA